jgi:hypothetical protein
MPPCSPRDAFRMSPLPQPVSPLGMSLYSSTRVRLMLGLEPCMKSDTLSPRRSGLVAAGGVHAELFLAPISTIRRAYQTQDDDPVESDGNWTSTVRLHGSINNALFFTNLALASSPYHLPFNYNAVGSMPRLFVSNNDCTMRVYNVATHISSPSGDCAQDVNSGRRKRQHRLSKAGVLQAKTCVNHGRSSLSALPGNVRT